MPSEFQSTQPRSAALGESYPYVEATERRARPVHAQERVVATTFQYRCTKRVFDVLLVLLSLPVLLPLLAVISALVILSSRGPVFYSHRRIRQNGAFFSMWKFRTMCENSAEVLEDYLASHPEARMEWNRTHKLKRDPRITGVGRVLRRYSMDELPQVWNVVRGQMTLVGPRPIVAAEVEKYGDSFQHYCHVKPGLTGLWQVSGRSELSYAQRVALDCDYVQRWSLRRDVVILSRTLSSVVNKDGAY